MPGLNPVDVAAKWAANTKNAGKAYEAGVQAVDSSPTEAAAQKVDKYLEGVREAANSGKYAAGLRAVSLQDWKQATITKGARRLSDGVSAAQPKMQQVMAQLLPQIEQIRASVRAMPDMTEADRDARMLENARRMRQIKIRKNG